MYRVVSICDRSTMWVVVVVERWWKMDHSYVALSRTTQRVVLVAWGWLPLGFRTILVDRP